ncbi:aldolase [Mycena belliarum]|uniref:Aldolase n=1 Tax=Mycena belliarum TaxID=1033014 RepID=A0AAD6U2S0_9AGAR|nr:aldolase [Mycena belliae]
MSSSTTLLAQVRTLVTVDVDSMDPDVAARHSAVDKFCDMTSNQAIVHGQAARTERSELLKAAVEYVRGQTKAELGATFEQDVVDVLTVLLAKEVYPHLTGNVHAQTSPSAAYDTQKTIKHARKLVALFAAHGIPLTRVCIKIPATPESLVACRELQAGGIQTLATCLFSVPQAVAASQASCTYVAPYFNELRVHFQAGLWKDYGDKTSTEHPMSPVIFSIVQAFRALGSKTLVMPASIVTAAEVIALVSLSPNHLTLSGDVLDALAALPAIAPESFVAPSLSTSPSVEGDYLANGGAMLRDALAADSEVQRKLADALAIFGEKEVETRELVRAFVGRM